MGKKTSTQNITNDPRSEEVLKAQDEIIMEHIPPPHFTMITEIDLTDPYNWPFSKQEFHSALRSCKAGSAPGKDGISFEILKKLSNTQLEKIRNTINECFVTSSFPESWRTAIVKFIPKPGGKGLRPISLTSCLGKLTERMVQRRLDHFVEHNNLMPSHQFGFRKERSGLDCVSVLTLDILRGFSLQQKTVVLALDVKGAFNSLLPSAILQQLIKVDTPPRITNFVAFMITNRNITFAADFEGRRCNVGVPQGGVLSPLLFNLTLRNIRQHLPQEVRLLQFADDIIIYQRTSNINEALANLEIAAEILNGNLGILGLKLAPEKSQLCIFDQKPDNDKQWDIEILGQKTPNLNNITYLGVKMDTKLTWRQHIEHLETKAHRGLVRAILEWGGILIAGAAKKYLKNLDKLQYSSIRTILGCMKSTPIPILLAEANEPTLSLRRERLLKRNSIRYSSWSENPISPRIKLLKEKAEANKRFPKYVINFPLVAHNNVALTLLSFEPKIKKPCYFDYPWEEISYDLNSICDKESGLEIKNSTDKNIALETYLLHKAPNHTPIFTDGSYHQKNDHAGAGVYIPELNFRYGTRVEGAFSSLAVELFAIYQSIKLIKEFQIAEAIIFTDSLHGMELISGRMKNFEHEPIIFDIARLLIKLIGEDRRAIKITWIPSHEGIELEAVADGLAKMAVEMPMSLSIRPLRIDLKKMMDEDSRTWEKLSWPYFPTVQTRQLYFQNITQKTNRPWFVGLDSNRRTINLITRFRSKHICTADHFERMGWNISPLCLCEEGTRSLSHFFNDCRLLEDKRPKFKKFINSKLGKSNMHMEDWDRLIYYPEPDFVQEIGDFFNMDNLII